MDPRGVYMTLERDFGSLKSGFGFQGKSQAYVDAKGKKLQRQIKRVLDANVPVHGAPDDIIAERARLAAEKVAKKKLKSQRIREAANRRREKIRKLAIEQGSNPEIEKGRKGFIRSKVLPGQDPIYLGRDSRKYWEGQLDNRGQLKDDLLLDPNELLNPGRHVDKRRSWLEGEEVIVDNPLFRERFPEGTQLSKDEIALLNAAQSQAKQVEWGRRERGFRAAKMKGNVDSEQGLIAEELRFRKNRIRSAASRPESPVPWERPIDTTEVIPPTRYVTKGSPPTRAERAMFDKWWEQVKKINTKEAPKRTSGRQAKPGTYDLDKQPVNPRWDPRRVGREEAIRNFVNDIAEQTRRETPRRPRKGDVGRPIGGKLRERWKTKIDWEDDRLETPGSGESKRSRNSYQILPDGNTKRGKATDDVIMGDNGWMLDDPETIQFAKNYRNERLKREKAGRIRRRINALNYEKEFVGLDPNNRYNRTRKFAEEYGYGDENRLQGGKLKTDNAAGKASVKRQFQDVKDRRGHGDTRHRPRKDDRIRKALAKKKPSPADGLQNQTRIPSTRRKPGSFTLTQSAPNRTVPVGRTALDVENKSLKQKKPSRRIRQRLQSRGSR
jgi:hypothetical protein